MSERAGEEVVDFFELDGRPVVINRQSNSAWVWSRGEWHRDPAVADYCYTHGQSFDREEFIRLHPYATLELLGLTVND